MKKELKIFVKENTWLTKGLMTFGWGNGYVLIPKEHSLHGKNYDDILDLILPMQWITLQHGLKRM